MSNEQPENDPALPKNEAHKVGTGIDGDVVPPKEVAEAAASVAEPGRVAAPAAPLYDLVEAAASSPGYAAPPVVEQEQSAQASVPEPTVEREPRVAEDLPVAQQTIYVPAPGAPAEKGNRGIGILIAIASTIVFAGLYSVVLAIILSLTNAGLRFDFLGSVTFYIPVIFFLLGFIALVVIANRANWWAYVLGSLFVGLFVYFGTIATGLVLGNVLAETPAGAARLFAIALSNPFVIAAAILAREVSMWMGASISARGRRVKAKNAETKADFDRETAERNVQYEQARYRAPESAV